MTRPESQIPRCERCGARAPLTYVPGPRPQYGDVGDSGRRLCDGCLDEERSDA